MSLSHNIHYLLYGIIFSISFCITAEEYKPCPGGFDLSYDERQNEYICYKLKGPEPFEDKYVDCEENIYTLELHFRLNITKHDTGTFWIDYSSLYPGGPYVNLENTKDEISEMYNLSYSTYRNKKKSCLVVTNKDILTAVACDEMHNRYCFIKSFLRGNDLSYHRDMKSYNNSTKNICELTVTNTSNVTWIEAKSLCENQSKIQINGKLSFRNMTWEKNQRDGVKHPENRNAEIEELLEQLLIDLRQLLDSELVSSDIDDVFDRLNELLQLEETVVFPEELLHLLQELGLRVSSWELTSTTVRSNTALLISSGQAATRGITVARSDDDIFTENTFNFLTDDVDLSMLDLNVNDAVLILPQEVTWTIVQMGNMAFRDDRVFYDSRRYYTVISRILSINILTSMDLEDYEIDLHLRPIIAESDTTSRRTCIRWHFQEETRYWSEDGCELILSDDPELLDTCKCKLFMTYYAMALFSEPTTPTTEISFTDSSTTTSPVTSTETTITDISYDTTVNSVKTTETTTTTEIILTPEEQIQELLEDLYELLNQTTPILVDDISQIFDQVDDLLDLDMELNFPGQMLQLLEELGARVDLNGFLTSAVVRNNIGLLMADVTDDNPVRGLIVASRDTDAFTQDAFEFLIGELDSSILNINASEAVVSLPHSVTRYPRRISFVVYRNEHIFSNDPDTLAINSRILSISVGNHTQFERGEVLDIHLRPDISEPNRDERRVCAYWHFLEDWTGYWSQEGCRLIKSRDPWTLDTCRCDHLTHFAEVLIPRTVFSQLNEDILEILSIIGCLLSIFGLVVIILTAVLFRSWRKNFRNQIWLQLCVALFLMSMFFLIAVFLKYDEYSISCILIGIGLHYSILASFCWMLVVAVKSYNDLVVIFVKQVPRKRLIASGFSWGVPVLIIGILLSVNSQSYTGHFEEKNPSSNFCYPSGTGLWVAVYMPIAVMILVNWTIFILIVWKIGFAPRGPRSHKARDSQEALACVRLSVVLVFLFGLPWLFGLFGYNVVAAYFFTCTVTTQGFVLFLLIICGNTQTRNLWLDKMKRKEHKSLTVSSNF